MSCAAKWAGYNWHVGEWYGKWRVNCAKLKNLTGGITTATFPQEAPFGPGDILVRHPYKPHVVTVYKKDGDSIDIIEAAGGSPSGNPPGSVVREWPDRSLSSWLNDGYVKRRLVYTP